jgi:hypothetical protein
LVLHTNRGLKSQTHIDGIAGRSGKLMAYMIMGGHTWNYDCGAWHGGLVTIFNDRQHIRYVNQSVFKDLHHTVKVPCYLTLKTDGLV